MFGTHGGKGDEVGGTIDRVQDQVDRVSGEEMFESFRFPRGVEERGRFQVAGGEERHNSKNDLKTLTKLYMIRFI